jgi:Ca2+-binding EF-hand superfamily protein
MSSQRILTKTINKVVKKNVPAIDPEIETLYSEAFSMLDTEDKGTINPDQVKKFLKKIGQNLTRAEVIEMIEHLEHDGSYNIRVDQFITLMIPKIEEEKIEVLEEDEIIKAFRKFDYDKDGKLTGAEFRYVLTKLAKGLSEKEADNILKIVNVKNDDYFDFVELVDFWKTFTGRGK